MGVFRPQVHNEPSINEHVRTKFLKGKVFEKSYNLPPPISHYSWMLR